MPAVDLDIATADTLVRMLRRLPASLWDIDPASPTLQRDLYHAIAAQLAVFLEQREIARTMTLLREAQGVDLDALLADYGLRRYLQRPDAYARQIGMNILWTPKGTLYAVARLADLLFDLPHVTLRTGRSQQHVFVAATHPITTPHSYWALVSNQGLWYAVTVNGGVPTISQAPPPGLDISPGPHTLTWFTVEDELGTTWYVSIRDDTLHVDPSQPSGYGTTEPFAVLDGQGNRYLLSAHSSGVLVSTIDIGLSGFGTWRITSRTGTLYQLWIEAGVPTIGTTPPGGSVDQTPGGAALDYFAVDDETGASWYVIIDHDTLFVQSTPPGGVGTEALAEFLDVTTQRWVLSVHRGSEVLVATAVNPLNADLVVVAPDAPFQAFQLVDSSNVPWWFSMSGVSLVSTSTLPVGAADVTPPGGPYHWWRLYDLAGTLWYAWPSTSGVLTLGTVSPGGLGTREPQILGDRDGVLWHAGVDGNGDFAMSDAPPVSYTGLATAICLADATGAKWFWRVHGQVLEWSPFLWPDAIDQSPWGELGWLKMLNTAGATRYVFPTPLGDPMAAPGPPSTWGWDEPFTFVDAAGTPWTFDILPDDGVGILPGVPDDIPLPTEAIPLSEALEALAHVQAAGSALTLLLS